MKQILKYTLVSIIIITIILLIFSCGLNSSHLIGGGLDEGNKNFRESFIKVENRFSARECKENECTIQSFQLG